MTCSNCKRDKKIVANDLCEACYRRHRKTGSFEYQRLGRVTPCSMAGCDKPAVSNGLCDMHRKRVERHGSAEERNDGRGSIAKHPMRNAWQHMHRYRKIDMVCAEWWSDFLQFVTDVGERSSPRHKLYAMDDSKPFGPSNFAWRLSPSQRAEGEDDATYKARRARIYRGVKTEQYTEIDLKRNYGISGEQVARMLEAQGHVCAICRLPETKIIKGRVIALSVDHCHAQGHVRALLCAACNTGLGAFRDNPDLLRAAISYLEGHLKNTKTA